VFGYKAFSSSKKKKLVRRATRLASRGGYICTKKNSITGGPQKIKSNSTRRLKVHHSSINGATMFKND
jgi:hypothetical protein